MPFNPPVVNDEKKKSSRIGSGGVAGPNEVNPFEATYIYRKASTAITVGQVLTFTISDWRSAGLASHVQGSNIFLGVAMEAATAGEAAAGKVIKIQTAGICPNVKCGVTQPGYWATLSAVGGTADGIDPATIPADAAAAGDFVRDASDKFGVFLEVDSGGLSSVFIIPPRS